MPVNGLVTMTPTSVAKTGTGSTATINTNGSVTFSTCATLSLNGVFTSSYDNYMVAVRSVGSGLASLQIRLRASGTDNSTTSSYVAQELTAVGTTISAVRNTTTAGYVGSSTSTQREGHIFYLFGPQLSQATAYRTVSVSGNISASIYDYAGTHNQATSYDGFTIICSGTFSGLMTVYGFNQ